jgi:glycyl-tRNA synthetase
MSVNPLSFQEVIMRLERYWADQGCLIWQPYSEKVGAGTGNPSTVLRVLGPEPWRVAYVEPSYRPDDGRYAENPNRMQMHTQYQVILKPAPANSQELYLRSLEAIGIDRNQHDIRFVEDNWESPALGAWGLGWEVWLDGLEISQYTYFQQAGGYPLDPVPVEYTYGLERIVMYLQGVTEVWQIDWDGKRTYGDILKLQEIEHCKYDFEVADVGRLKLMYDLFEAEAKNALSHRLVVPAHDYVLRCSHTFNLLDARGAIGVTERQYYFARMRELARQVSVAYYEQRQHEEFPWLEDQRSEVEGSKLQVAGYESEPSTFNLQPATYLLEIGVEELPAADLPGAIEQLRANMMKLLADLRLPNGGISVSGTPRRLVALVKDLAPRQADEETVVKGPPAERAYDAAGAATPAAVGFARKQGVPVEALEVRQEGSGKYVFAVVRKEGRDAPQVLAEALPGLVASIKFGKAMRWNSTNITFSRPVRWFVSLLGETVVPFQYAGLTAGRTTVGPRAAGSPEFDVPGADAYLPLMAAHHVMVDRDERRAEVSRQVAALAGEVGGAIPVDPGLLEEVTDLVEQPTALRGGFGERYLKLPKEVLITVMRKHQRYFPVVDGQGKMLSYFVAVRNGPEEHLDVVQAGNEGVLRARYADANYFFRADTAKPLAAFTPRLATLTFQEKLGSMLDKVHRVERLVPALAAQLGLSAEEQATAQAAAGLFKSDLATQMVVELTSLQGVMGREYARISGEPDEVAAAIWEHYLPRYQGDALPGQKPGLLIGIANRLDSLVGLFAVGLAPTSTADPFGLRRDALGLVAALAGCQQSFDLRTALQAVASEMPVPVAENVVADVLGFIRDRLYGWLRDQGLPHDIVSAVLAQQSYDPAAATASARGLARLTQSPDWSDVLTAYARCKRLVRNVAEQYTVAPGSGRDRYTEPATRGLYEAVAATEARHPAGVSSVEALAEVLRDLKAPINRFFTDVLVMADDPNVRAARLALVQRVAALPDRVADLSQLQGF